MSKLHIRKVAVLGAGVMGAQIAHANVAEVSVKVKGAIEGFRWRQEMDSLKAGGIGSISFSGKECKAVKLNAVGRLVRLRGYGVVRRVIGRQRVAALLELDSGIANAEHGKVRFHGQRHIEPAIHKPPVHRINE